MDEVAETVEVDAQCDVCRSTESEEGNEMVFCDKCDICVHQGCYGIEVIPKESWFCKPCEQNIQPTCVFCLQEKGAMKTTVDGRWAHVNCTLWIPLVVFDDPVKMENIKNIEKLPKSRWSLNCCVCHRKGGACIQCTVPQCKTAYHVTCAYDNAFHMVMEDEANSDFVKFETYCKKHTLNLPKKKLEDEKPKRRIEKITTPDSIFNQFLPNGKDAKMKATNASAIEASDSDTTNVQNVQNDNSLEYETSQAMPSIISNDQLSDDVNGNQIVEVKVHNPTPDSAYIGETLVHKATARKSFAVPKPTQALPKKQHFNLSSILPKAKNVKTKASPKVPPEKEPKQNPPKRKADQPPADEPSSFDASPSPLKSALKKSKPSRAPKAKKTPQAKLSKVPFGTVTPSTSSEMQVAAFTQYQQFSTPVGPLANSENGTLSAFLGYMGTLLSNLPEKKLMKTQRKLIMHVLKEQYVSSSSDELSDVSSLSD